MGYGEEMVTLARLEAATGLRFESVHMGGESVQFQAVVPGGYVTIVEDGTASTPESLDAPAFAAYVAGEDEVPTWASSGTARECIAALAVWLGSRPR